MGLTEQPQVPRFQVSKSLRQSSVLRLRPESPKAVSRLRQFGVKIETGVEGSVAESRGSRLTSGCGTQASPILKTSGGNSHRPIRELELESRPMRGQQGRSEAVEAGSILNQLEVRCWQACHQIFMSAALEEPPADICINTNIQIQTDQYKNTKTLWWQATCGQIFKSTMP